MSFRSTVIPRRRPGGIETCRDTVPLAPVGGSAWRGAGTGVVLIAAMACYLNLSRRNELVIARSAGMSAWQFITPALLVAFMLGIIATTLYNPVSATLQERSLGAPSAAA